MSGAVELDHVSKRYPGSVRTTIEDLSLSVGDGEFVVLLGPSGCGKSTVLRLVAGLVPVSGGRVSIGGRDVTGASPKDRNVAMVFQSYALFPHLSVYDNLAFGMRVRKAPRSEIDAKVRAAAAGTGLSELLEKKPRELSGGQSQRVALGRALVRDPAAFLFDEPLSNLDPDLRGRMRAELVEFRSRARGAIIYVTHDQLEAMTLADRIVVLDDGVVQQIGAPLDVYNEPANRFVASFLGATPMNFLSTEAFGALLKGGDVVPALEASAAGPTVGIRPEDMYLAERCAAGVRASPSFPATVNLLEALGDGAILHCATRAGALVARLRHQFRAGLGQQVELVLDLERARAFDSAGRSLGTPGRLPSAL